MGGSASKPWEERDIFPEEKREKKLSRIKLSNPLLVAVGKGNVERVKVLVKRGEDVNLRNSNLETALMKAAYDGNVDIIRFLIDSGAAVNAVNHEGRTALIYATDNDNDIDVIRLLVQNGADVNASEKSSRFTPLLRAVKNGNVDVRFLIECDADVHAINLMGYTPFVYAIMNDAMEIVRILFAADVDATSNKVLLFYAIDKRRLNVARFLLENGADVNAVLNTYECTPLILATRKNDWQALQLLIKCKADMNAVCSSGTTALMHAISVGNLKMARFLFECGASIHAVNRERSTVLIQAATTANYDIIKFLIEAGADVNAVNMFGRTSLQNATECGGLKTVQLLVENGADVNAAGMGKWTPVMYAAGNGKWEIVQYLLASGAEENEIEKNKTEILVYACIHEAYRGNLDVIRYLLRGENNFNVVDESGKTLMMHAAGRAGRMDIVKFLVEGGANVNAVDNDNCTPLLHASENGNWDVVRFLVRKGANVNAVGKSGWTPLLYAIDQYCFKMIRHLVKYGANVNAVTNDGATTMLLATNWGIVDVIRFFVKAGADINAGDNDKWTPLMEAAFRGDFAVAKFLVDRGADVNTTERFGRSALMVAAIKGKLDIMKILSHRGAEINVVDKDGWTVLMHAVQRGNVDAVQLLLDAGADMNIANNEGRTATFIASTHDYTNIQRLLMQNISYFHKTVVNASTQMPVHCFISPFEVSLRKLIGPENVGGDYRALWLDADVVIKLFVSEASVSTFSKEVEIWHQLRHPNVIKLYGACDIGHHFFVCEWANNGSLVEYLTACEKRGEGRKPWKFLHEAALGLAYLHERNIVHGNMCNNSILVGSDGLTKLADFQVGGSSTIISDERSDVGFGWYCWQAPERLKGEAASFASDIYSFCLCVMAAVTGTVPWDHCRDNTTKVNGKWSTTAFPRYGSPIIHMTEDLKMLESKMCGDNPHSRVSASVAVRMLESLAIRESNKHQQSHSKSDVLVDISQYMDGEILRKWRELQDLVSTITIDQPQLAVFRELETLYIQFSAEDRSVVLLKRCYKLISDCIGVIDTTSHQYRILRLSSTKAQGRSITGIYRRIDALWDDIGDVHSENRKQRREEQRLQQREAFISELSQTLIVLDELETDKARNTLVAFLKTEVDSHGSSYTEAQLTILERAFIELKGSLKSEVVASMPEWFLPWYELEIDGANFLAEGAFGKVYRAKWLESEVIVKQVKLTSSSNSDSGESHSLSASLSVVPHSTEKTRKEKREMFEHEVGIWFGLSHPHVVRLFGACHVGIPLFACEYASNGSLDKYLHQHPKVIWQKLHEAALGVQYLHSRGIIHGDLKCNNIVVGGDNKAKVTDFGLSSANVVTGAWHWVAPECLEKGPSQLSTASDIYALGMCIVEALRIVKITATNNESYVSLPWGNIDNNAVKYHVTKSKKLPSRPEFCSDSEWGLVVRMCAYKRSDRIKISTVVDDLAVLASGEAEYPVTDIKLVKLSQVLEEVETMRCVCYQQQLNHREESSSNQSMLRSVYGLLWDRVQDICTPSIDFGYLQPLFDRARIYTQQLEESPNTLTSFTEMATNGYALHRQLDKVIDANFWSVDYTSGGLHDWKSKCIAAIDKSGLVSM